jgi:methylmalonyl-CoA mutase
MSDKKQILFSDFPPVSSMDWKKKVVTDSKGVNIVDKLVWRTKEGFNVEPFYRSEDLERLSTVSKNPQEIPATRGSRRPDNNWKIRQDFSNLRDPKKTNEEALNAIEGGAEALGFDLSRIRNADKKFLSSLLKDIQTQHIELYFSNASDPVQFTQSLLAFTEESKINKEDLTGSLGFDPLGTLAVKGTLPYTLEELAECIQLLKQSPDLKIISINAGLFQDAGAMLYQELGFGLSIANAYIEELHKAGIRVENALAHISFCFVCGPHYFMEVAKLRAAKWLWSVFCDAWGIKESNLPMHIQSQTATWNRTVYDPHVNLLRATTEAMSASLGGSDVISVLPFDIAFKKANDFSTRLSRNIQIILKEESYFHKVADPAGGSYYIEQLTESLGEEAWKHFLEIEEKGGFSSAFQKGWIQEQVSYSSCVRKERAAQRKDTILGVNLYPNREEKIQDALPETDNNTNGANVIRPFKVAQDFQLLRLLGEKLKRKPCVFPLKYGNPAWSEVRAIFTSNFFAVAGYEIMDTPIFSKLDEGVKAAKASKADIVVLCSSDETYPEMVREVTDTLQGIAEIVIAGYPKNIVDSLKERGIKHFIHVKCNVLEELEKFNELMLLRIG